MIKIKKLHKKGGEFKAGMLFTAIVVYFFFFILIASGGESLSTLSVVNESQVTIDLGTVEFSALVGSSYCTNPRYFYNTATGEKEEYTKAQRDRLFCEESVGSQSQTVCEDIEGCVWENVTSGWWFWETTESASCIGDINATYYNISQTDPIIGRPRVSPHNNTGVFSIYTPFSDPSPCEHPNVLLNKTLCDMFFCTWTPVELDTSFTSASTIFSTVSDVFTFRYDFGFSNQTVTLLLNFIFIILPLLGLIIAIYYMIPFFH